MRKQGYNDGSCRKYNFNQRIFKNCDTPEKAYWLGYLMADGHIDKNRSVSLVSKDKELMEKWNKFLKVDYPMMLERGKYYRLRAHSTKMVADLAQYGIVPHKTGNECIKNIPPRFYGQFIRGYFDGDGYFGMDKKSGVFTLVSSSKVFLKRIQTVLVAICDVGKPKIRVHGVNTQCFSLTYKGNRQLKRIYEYLYDKATVYLNRKKNRWEACYQMPPQGSERPLAGFL